jgi:hypothetical protein
MQKNFWIDFIVVESIAVALRANTRNPPSAYLGKNRVRRGGVEKIVVDCRY